MRRKSSENSIVTKLQQGRSQRLSSGKSWGRSQNLICYFTDTQTGLDFLISCFRAGDGYGPKDGSIDFSEAGIVGNKYQLTITSKSNSKYPNIDTASLIDSAQLGIDEYVHIHYSHFDGSSYEPNDNLSKLIDRTSEQELCRVISDPETPYDFLYDIAEYEELSEKALSLLAEIGDHEIKTNIAGNSSANQSLVYQLVLEELSLPVDDRGQLAEWATYNDELSSETLKLIIERGSLFQMWLALRHANAPLSEMPPELRFLAAKDLKSSFVNCFCDDKVKAALKSKGIPPKARKLLKEILRS